MFSVHNNDNDVQSFFRDFFTAAQYKSLVGTAELKELSDSDNESCNSDCNSVMSNREELLITQNIELKDKTDNLRLLLEAQKLETEQLKKTIKILVEQLEHEKCLRRVETQKVEALQHQVEIEIQAKERAEQEVFEERQAKARELAARLEAQQIHAVTNATCQTMLVQMKTHQDILEKNLLDEQAQHKADNEFWRQQDALLRSHIYGPVSKQFK